MTTFIDSSTSSQRTIHASSSIPTIQTYGSLWATTFPIQDDIVTVDKLLTTMPSICRGFCVTLGKHVAHIPGYPKSSTSSLTIVDTEASQSVAKALLTTTIPNNTSTLPDYILSEVSSLPCFMHAAVSRPAAPSTPVGVIHIYRNTDNTLRTICRPLSDDHACHTALDQKLAGDLVMLSGVIAAFTQSFIPLSPALLHHVTSMATQPPGQHSAARVLLEHGVTALSTIGATPPSTMISLLDRLASVTTGMDDHAASVSTYQSIIKNFADELVPHDVQRSGVTRLGTYSYLGLAHKRVGEFEEARDAYLEGLRVIRDEIMQQDVQAVRFNLFMLAAERMEVDGSWGRVWNETAMKLLGGQGNVVEKLGYSVERQREGEDIRMELEGKLLVVRVADRKGVKGGRAVIYDSECYKVKVVNDYGVKKEAANEEEKEIKCDGCKNGVAKEKAKKCSCGTVWYHNVGCQKAGWPGHREDHKRALLGKKT